jgi:transposase-like protein
MKKTFSPELKTKVALEAIKGLLTVSQIASQYEIHPQQVGRWKKEAEEILKSGFTDKRQKENFDQQRIIDNLHRAIGQKEMAIDWLKKKLQPFGLSDKN